MDEDRIEALGITPIEGDLKRALSLTTKSEFLKVLGEFEARGNGGLFYSYINTDARDANTYIAYIGQSGLSLPDEAYYREEQYVEIRSALLLHIEKMFALAKVEGAALHAANVLELETAIASFHWDQVRDRDAEPITNTLSKSSKRWPLTLSGTPGWLPPKFQRAPWRNVS